MPTQKPQTQTLEQLNSFISAITEFTQQQRAAVQQDPGL